MYRSLKVEKKDGVAEVILTGPGKGNAMGPDFWREMPTVFRALDEDDDARAVILRGDGKTFSYGLDLAAVMGDIGPLMTHEAPALERTKLFDLILRWQQAFNEVARCRKPVIAAVHGWCIGGGLDAIAACDVRLCSKDARFSLREVKLAIVSDMGSLQRLPALIGEGATRELAFTGGDFDAERARELRLVSAVFADVDALLVGARKMARDIAANPPLVVQGIKRVMNERIVDGQERTLRHVATWNAAFLASQDLAEAMAAFMEKRTPVFKGR